MKKIKISISFLAITLIMGFSNAKSNSVFGQTNEITCYLISLDVCHTVIVHDPIFGPLRFPTYGVKAPPKGNEK